MRTIALNLLLLLAASAHATNFGPITIAVDRPLLAAARPGNYTERVFTISNISTQAHDVRLVINSGNDAFDTPISRSLTIGPRVTQRVSMAWLTYWQQAPMLIVTVDGKSFDQTLPLSEEGFAETSEKTVLVGRSLDDTGIQTAIKVPGVSEALTMRRAAIAPADWSTRWITYSRLSGMILTQRDWDELPAPVQAAILRWVRLGGVVSIVPSPHEEVSGTGQVATTYLGFGRIIKSTRSVERMTRPLMDVLTNAWTATPRGGAPDQSWWQEEKDLFASHKVPTATIFWTLLLFAIGVGPIALWRLARKNRRVWIFWIAPAAGMIVSVAIVGVTLAAEGIHDIAAMHSVTLLDEVGGEATTVGTTGFYCTFPKDGKVRFDADSEVIPAGSWRRIKVDLTDGQRYTDLVQSRVPTFVALRKSEPRRERVVFRKDGSGVVAVNGLGATIDDLRVAMPDGSCWRGRRLAPGAQQKLEAEAPPKKFAETNALYQLLIEVSPQLLPSHVRNDVGGLLRPGVYVATVASSPFTEAPLGKGGENSSPGTIIGLMNVKGAADAR